MTRPLTAMLSLASLLLAPDLAVAADAPVPASMASTQQIDFQSGINGESYRIQIFIPSRSPPPGGYPVLYVLDGNALFGTFSEAERNRAQAGELEAAVVVGIASGQGPHRADRTLDFTPGDMTPREKQIIKDLGPNPPFGGADAFLRVIQEEIKPRVASVVPTDKTRTGLFGWSLGGQFVMHTMFAHPDAFTDWLALSPSLWRAERAIFREVPDFEHRADRRAGPVRLFMGVGSLEEQAPPGVRIGQMSGDQLTQELRYVRMVGNARDMADTLRPYFAGHGWPFDFRIFEGNTHNNVPWSAVNPVLDFEFSVARK